MSNLYQIRKQNFFIINIQRRSPGSVLQKTSSEKLHNVHRKTLIPEYLFIKVAKCIPGTLLKRDSKKKIFFLEDLLLKNTPEQLLQE